MKISEQDAAVLAERAEKLAQAVEAIGDREQMGSVVVVAAGPEKLGIPVSGVKEIVRAPSIARLHLPQPWILGLTQVRGEVVSVVDPALWFDLGALESRTPYLALLTGTPGDLGLLFDEVLDVRELHGDEISTETLEKARDKAQAKPFLGATSDLVLVLDVEKLLANEDLMVGIQLFENRG